jgi:hypothetical protein
LPPVLLLMIRSISLLSIILSLAVAAVAVTIDRSFCCRSIYLSLLPSINLSIAAAAVDDDDTIGLVAAAIGWYGRIQRILLLLSMSINLSAVDESDPMLLIDRLLSTTTKVLSGSLLSIDLSAVNTNDKSTLRISAVCCNHNLIMTALVNNKSYD